MTNLLYYRTRVFLDRDLTKYSDLQKFRQYFNLYSMDVVPLDRSETIKFPVFTKNLFPLPKFKEFKKTYQDICNDRAKEILKKADTLSLPIKIMYSGGIDSTLIVVSFLKNATAEQLQNITVLLSEESIQENPNFYRNFLIGKIKLEPSIFLPEYIGSKKHIIVNGEHNDQLFGADIIGVYIRKNDSKKVFLPYTEDLIVDFFEQLSPNKENNLALFRLFDKLCKAAPVKILTVFDFFWWINFSCKWQCVFFRSLMYTKKENQKNLDQNYIENFYFTFYGSEEFQLWSMNNMDKKIKDEWKTYKYVAKEIIYKFNNDRDYFQNKTKIGSLSNVAMDHKASAYLTEKFEFQDDLDFSKIYNSQNSFV